MRLFPIRERSSGATVQPPLRPRLSAAQSQGPTATQFRVSAGRERPSGPPESTHKASPQRPPKSLGRSRELPQQHRQFAKLGPFRCAHSMPVVRMRRTAWCTPSSTVNAADAPSTHRRGLAALTGALGCRVASERVTKPPSRVYGVTVSFHSCPSPPVPTFPTMA